MFQSQQLLEAHFGDWPRSKNRISRVVMGFTNICKRPIVGAEDIQGAQNPHGAKPVIAGIIAGIFRWGQTAVVYRVVFCVAARLVKAAQALGAALAKGAGAASTAAQVFLEKLPELVGLLFTLFVAIYTLYPLANAFRVGQLSPALRLPAGILYAVQAALYLLMSIRYFVRLFGPKASQGSRPSQGLE